MVTRKSGVTIAMAAILVQAPRLVLAVLAADHQEIGAAAERWLLVVAGIGTATVLTGGNLYLGAALFRRDETKESRGYEASIAAG